MGGWSSRRSRPLTARSCLATSIRPRPFQYFSTSFFGLATVVVVQVTVVPSGWVTVVVVLISISGATSSVRKRFRVWLGASKGS
eukprot:COSAG02_NODE_4578_length_5200_cov_2.867673_6_plen_84_part_00